MEDYRPEGALKSRDDRPIALHAPLMQLGVVLQVEVGELPERDVRLSADAGDP